jgi:hypothetical protein
LNASNIDVTKTASGYVPGTTYDVVIKTYLGNKVKAGFQCVPLTFITALPAGTVLNTVMPTMMQITPDASNRQYVSHTTTGTTSSTVIAGGYATWKFKWQAPSSDIGAINFHCITNVTNNNNLSDGDSIRLATFTIQKPSSVDAVAFETVSVYPNPSHDHLQLLNLPETQGSLWIMNQVGQLIQTQKGNITSIDLLSVPAGSYFIWIKTNSGKSYQSRFVKY